MTPIRLIVLTKSRMRTERQKGVCVTGMTLDNQKIVRLVSSEQGDPVFEPFSSRFELLDIIMVNMYKTVPIGPQTENCNVYLKTIERIGHYDGSIENLCQSFTDCLKEESYMENTDYKLESVGIYHHSLELVRVKNLELSVHTFENNGRPVTTASFTINDDGPVHKYYRVTDTDHELDGGSDNVIIGEAVIAVSIPKEPYMKDGENKGYFKFIAAIYELGRDKGTATK